MIYRYHVDRASRFGARQSGVYTWIDRPTSKPKKDGGATPTIWYGVRSSEIVVPMTDGDSPYSLCQNPYPRTAMGGQPRTSSACVSSRPSAGRTPSVEKKSPLTE